MPGLTPQPWVLVAVTKLTSWPGPSPAGAALTTRNSGLVTSGLQRKQQPPLLHNGKGPSGPRSETWWPQLCAW